MAAKENNYAYVTLITRSSYLAGVIVLAYTLKRAGSKYPLVVYYTDSVPQSSIAALTAEAPHSNLILHRTTALLPRSSVKVNLIAERFGDTWTKLRVFDLVAYDKVCYLDADMTIRGPMDTVFATPLPGPDWLAANHACVCNLDGDTWAPADWTAANCAYTAVTHPAALTHPTPVTPASPPTHHLLNSGMFVFAPSAALWDELTGYFATCTTLADMKFPDQDFLAEFFAGRWCSVGWQFNALKTMRYWHENIWRDDEVVCLHYIVDKPWAKRVGDDGVAGYLGRDGTTHQWWWDDFESWRSDRLAEGQDETVRVVSQHAARPLGDDGEESEELRAIGSQVQAFAKNKPES